MWEIDGNDITDKKCKLAANKRGLKQYGTERRLRDLKGKHFDLVVVGSVAVCPRSVLINNFRDFFAGNHFSEKIFKNIQRF